MDSFSEFFVMLVKSHNNAINFIKIHGIEVLRHALGSISIAVCKIHSKMYEMEIINRSNTCSYLYKKTFLCEDFSCRKVFLYIANVFFILFWITKSKIAI